MSYMRNYPPKPGSGRTAPIVDQAMIIDIQLLLNKTEPEGSTLPPLNASGQLDNTTIERLWHRYGDIRNLADADLKDPVNSRLLNIPPELRAAIVNYQQAAPSREERELRNERFSLPTAFRDATENTDKNRRTTGYYSPPPIKAPLFAQLSKLGSLLEDSTPSENTTTEMLQ